MLIGIDSSPCSLSLRNRSTLCLTTKCHQNKSDLKNVFVQKSFFFNIFYSFNPNHAYWNQRRLFSGILPGMFVYSFCLCFLKMESMIFCTVYFVISVIISSGVSLGNFLVLSFSKFGVVSFLNSSKFCTINF